MENYFEIFESPAQMVRTLAERKQNKHFEYKHSSETNSEYFTGTKSYQEAGDLLANGDTKNFELVMKEAARVKLPAKYTDNQNKKTFVRTPAGCFANVPAYLSGSPKSMISITKNEKRAKIANIVINSSVNGGVEAEDIIKAGAKITRLVIALENQGIRVNLYTGCASKKEGQILTMFCKIKTAEAPLNKLKIVYPLVNPSFTRRHFFKFIETCPIRIYKKFNEAYGCPIMFNQGDEEITNKFGKQCIIINLYELIERDTDIATYLEKIA